MGLAADQYLAQLQALMPPGAAWTREPDANLTRLLAAIAEEFARVDKRAEELLTESDPYTTSELLPDWERVFDLPNLCLYAVSQTVSQRRLALVAKMSSVDDLSKQFFINLSAAVGYTITIDENVDGSPFKWRVNSAGVSITDFTVGASVVGDPLREWGDELLECTVRSYQPAHTEVLFAYLAAQPSGIASSNVVGTPTVTNP